MPRLFVALDLPDAHQRALLDLRDHTLAARWTPAGQHHLTLRFIGEADAHRLARLQHALAQVQGTVFDLNVKGLGVFPSRRKPRVLFSAVEPVAALLALQQQISAALLTVGVDEESRPFHPHVTLARLKGARPQVVRRYLKEHAAFSLPATLTTDFHLYQSTLNPGGAQHDPLVSFPLTLTP